MELSDQERARRRQRELDLQRYIRAMDAGDLETVGGFIADAATDPELAEQLWGINLALDEERQEEDRILARLLEEDEDEHNG